MELIDRAIRYFEISNEKMIDMFNECMKAVRGEGK